MGHRHRQADKEGEERDTERWKECTKTYKKANRHQGVRVIQMSISSSGIIIHCQAGDNGLEKPEGLGDPKSLQGIGINDSKGKIRVHVTP